jgi:transposase
VQRHTRFHYAVWQQGGGQVRAVDHLLRDLARGFREEVRRLETVPGVGPTVALTAVAVFADVERFASAKRVASYAGLVPSTYQAGETVIAMAISPSGVRPSSARCSARLLITLSAHRIRSIRTS